MSNIFQKWATTDLSTCRLWGSIFWEWEVRQLRRYDHSTAKHGKPWVQWRSNPWFWGSGDRLTMSHKHPSLHVIIRQQKNEEQGNTSWQTIMKQLPRFVPFVWAELPRLTCSHDAYYTLPGIRAKFRECFHTIHYKISWSNNSLLSACVDCSSLSINWNKIFGSQITFCCSSSTSFLGGLKPAIVSIQFFGLRVHIHWVFEEFFDIVHCDKGSRWWRNHNDGLVVTYQRRWTLLLNLLQNWCNLRALRASNLGSNSGE